MDRSVHFVFMDIVFMDIVDRGVRFGVLFFMDIVERSLRSSTAHPSAVGHAGKTASVARLSSLTFLRQDNIGANIAATSAGG